MSCPAGSASKRFPCARRSDEIESPEADSPKKIRGGYGAQVNGPGMSDATHCGFVAVTIVAAFVASPVASATGDQFRLVALLQGGTESDAPSPVSAIAPSAPPVNVPPVPAGMPPASPESGADPSLSFDRPPVALGQRRS